MAFTLKTTWSGPTGRHTTTQAVTRSANAVRMAVEGGHEEWLFVRNLHYPDRASGYLIDHPARQIRPHEESRLGETLHIRGWSDVLTMRFDPATLEHLRDTGERRSAGGATFARFAAVDPTNDGIEDVWWSDALLLPLSLNMRQGASHVSATIEGLTRQVDASVLVDPMTRFPDYEVRDPSDADDR